MTSSDVGTAAERSLPALSATETTVDPRRLGLWAGIVGLFAVAASAAGSWIPSLWGDEAASLMSSTRPVSSLWHMLSYVDAVHGLYYLGLHAWIDVFGSSAFSIRFPSALAIGVCTAAVVWLCGRFGSLGSLGFAILAGVFTATLPRLIFAGEEARSYAIGAAFAAVLCAILVEIAQRDLAPSVRRARGPGGAVGWWIAYGAVLTVAIWTFLYFALMVFAVAVMVACSAPLRQRWRAWAVSTAVPLVLSLPVAYFGFLQRRQIAFLAVRESITPDVLLRNMWFQEWWFAAIAWALILVAAVPIVVEVVRIRRSGGVFGLRLETIAFAWMIVPMGVLLAVTPFMAVYTARYGTFSAPAVAIVMALGVRQIVRFGRVGRVARGGRVAGTVSVGSGPAGAVGPAGADDLRRARLWRALSVVAVAAVLIAAVPVAISQRGPYSKNQSDWNDIASFVHANARAGDGIVFDDGARPSQRTRLAKDTDPAAFANTRDLLLAVPFERSRTWYDLTYSIPHAADLGRFDGVGRVWVVELKFDHVVDAWGLKQLAALGYHETRRVDGAGSVILLYER